MDYLNFLRSLSKRAANSFCYCARSAVFVSAALLIGLPVSAQAAVLKINDNVINLSGELSASVKHTSEGMEIEIPGVEITLDCDTAADPDNCTVTIGSGTGSSGSGTGSSGSGTGSSGSGTGSSGSGTGSTGSGSSSSSSDSDSDSDGNADCDPSVNFGCGDAYAGGGDSSNGSDDSDTSSDSGGGTGTGYTTGTTSSSDDDDPCGGTGYNPACNTNTGASTTASDAFPTGSARKIDNKSGSLNFGSANRSPKTTLTVASGTVTVLGLTMGTGSSPSSGTVDFAQASNISGVALRAWISTTPDGDRVGTCNYSGYPEGNVRFSIGGTASCNLSPGGTYYFNMALCSSTASDLYCKQSGAKAAPTGGVIGVSASYSD